MRRFFAMKTLLRHFCTEFDRHVRPLLAPLGALSDALDRLPLESDLRPLAARTRGLEQQLESLARKIAEQQVYVIIFGPLKSGKSTLMNAIAGDYVSEVTTLPAYPCMVYVGHAEQAQYTIRAYDGRTHSCHDSASLRELLERAHRELASRVRSVIAAGEDFDPAIHLPGAARRIDVRTPAPALGGSGALLVDTPGLYSRMKFGYDQMTRDFRNTAASAIFVVKTDNLFLEQVFEEFGYLLRLFSRIFLVVNIDGSKQDLEPDGTLRPSIEGRDPQQIIEAFERLAMSTELEAARRNGRLGIYPIDLLQAASRRLRRTNGNESGRSDDVFERFLGDLSDHLNGSGHLARFLGDSLRQANVVLDDLESLGARSPLGDLDARIAALETERGRGAALVAAVQRLEDYNWEEALGGLHDEVLRVCRERSMPIRTRTLEQLEAVLAGWFERDSSFASLAGDESRPALLACRDSLIELARDVSRSILTSDAGGAGVRREVSEDCGRLDLPLLDTCRAALDRVPAGAARPPALEISPDVLPVRRTLVDWLLFRSQAKVRRRLLGEDDAPTRTIPPRVKQKRLAPGRVELAEALRERFEGSFTETTARVAGDTFGAQAAAVCTEIRARLAAAKIDHRERLLAAETRLAGLSRVRESSRALAYAAVAAGAAVTRLAADTARAAAPAGSSEAPSEASLVLEPEADV
jgi:hypothetical protein